MAKIHVLEKHVAELIAAGEVVERPSSVIKDVYKRQDTACPCSASAKPLGARSFSVYFSTPHPRRLCLRLVFLPGSYGHSLYTQN